MYIYIYIYTYIYIYIYIGLRVNPRFFCFFCVCSRCRCRTDIDISDQQHDTQHTTSSFSCSVLSTHVCVVWPGTLTTWLRPDSILLLLFGSNT